MDTKSMIGPIIMLSVILTGCYSALIEIEADSRGECILGCKGKTKTGLNCIEVEAVYGLNVVNGELKDHSCECILTSCFQEVKSNIQEQGKRERE